jgi:hypothetical protein
MDAHKKFLAVPSDGDNVRLIPVEDIQVVRPLEARPGKFGSESLATGIFWALLLLGAFWYLTGGWEYLAR